MIGLAQRAVELSSAFDRSFAAPLRDDAAVRHDLLAMRVGGEACAVRLTAVAGLFADRKVTPVPGGNAALLGIAGFRGALLPVYSLTILFDGAANSPAPRWLVIAAAAPVAFAFDAFEGHVRAPADAILPQQSRLRRRDYAPEFVRTGDVVRAVLDLPSVIAALGAMPQRQSLQTPE